MEVLLINPKFFYLQAHAAILVFDGTRKITYKNLPIWYKELRQHRPEIPCFCAVNKIDGKVFWLFAIKRKSILNICFFHSKSIFVKKTVLAQMNSRSIDYLWLLFFLFLGFWYLSWLNFFWELIKNRMMNYNFLNNFILN